MNIIYNEHVSTVMDTVMDGGSVQVLTSISVLIWITNPILTGREPWEVMGGGSERGGLYVESIQNGP